MEKTWKKINQNVSGSKIMRKKTEKKSEKEIKTRYSFTTTNTKK